MKEKRYTLPEEQRDAAFAAEPAPAYHGNAAIALPEDECAEEDIDWNKIPVGWHPANEEEAMARIEAIEAEYENGQYIDAEDFERELIAQYPSIRLTLYFKKELKTVIDYGLVEFGKTTVKRFHNEYKDIKHRLMLHPLSSPREPLLKRFHRPYHSAIIKENWKIIYRYDEANDLVIFVDLWDMRRSPRYLIRQFKRKL